MAITLVGAGTTVADDTTLQTTGITVSPHESTLTDDFMLLVLGRDAKDDAWDDPPETGWTLIGQIQDTIGRDYRLMLAYKIATSDSEGSATFTGLSSTSGIENTGAIITYRGVDTTSPLDVVYSSGSHSQHIQNATNPSTHTYNAITTATDGAWAVVTEWLSNVDVNPSANPSGYSSDHERINSIAGNIQTWHKEIATATTESPGAAGYTVSNTTGDGGSITIALKPAAGGGGGGGGGTVPVIQNHLRRIFDY